MEIWGDLFKQEFAGESSLRATLHEAKQVSALSKLVFRDNDHHPRSREDL